MSDADDVHTQSRTQVFSTKKKVRAKPQYEPKDMYAATLLVHDK